MKKPNRVSREVAYHEAGHAVLHLILRLPLRQATIIPNQSKGSAGHVTGGTIPLWIRSIAHYGDAWEYPRALSRTLSEICALKAGHTAGRRATRRANWYGAKGDRLQAHDWIFLLVPERRLKEARALDNWLEARTTRLVKAHWKAIEGVAQELLQKRSLKGQEIRNIVQATAPAAVPEPSSSSSEHQQLVQHVALWQQGMSPAKIDAYITNLPPGEERRAWHQARRLSSKRQA